MSQGYERGEKFTRVLQLIELLTTMPRGLTTAELAGELEVEPRTVQRYIKHIRDNAGLDVQQENGRWLLGPDSRLPALQFTPEQAVTVLLALRLLHRLKPTQDLQLVGAISKLAKALSVPVIGSYLEATMRAAQERPADASRGRVESEVVRAFIQRRALAVDYVDAKGNQTARELRPYFLEPVAEARSVYVFALDASSGEVRSFRLDRIVEARMLPATFEVPASFDIDAVVASSWGVWQGGPVVEVVLRFNPEVARRVRQTVWHAGMQLTELPDGGVEMRVRVAGEVEIRPWVLGWGDAVEVLAPTTLREHVAGVMRRGAEIYARA